jgi:acyl dehydratase
MVTLNEYFVNKKFREEYTISEEKVKSFADLTGDKNPVHLNKDFAATTQFGKQIAHGMLIASYFSKILGNDLPGPGSIYLAQTLKFMKPVYIDEKIIIEVTITKIREDKPIITLSTICLKSDGNIAIEGEAVMKVL